MDERLEKMAEVSIEMMRLQEMRGLRPTWDIRIIRHDKYKQRHRGKNGWMFVFSGTKKDIIAYIALMLLVPIIVYAFISLATDTRFPICWAYIVLDASMVLMWINKSYEIKAVLDVPDDKDQEKIVRQKIAELKELDERLKREELQKKQEEQEKSDCQE